MNMIEKGVRAVEMRHKQCGAVWKRVVVLGRGCICVVVCCERCRAVLHGVRTMKCKEWDVFC